ncbi:MAG: 50S ribosomal protein L24e [Candidatus Aenigmarchaeota archaeon CG_4_10_14_0_8_um_filter_37_24]|nr:50S ribosomal protein L24e [Candidatus Aenigmarchaeota archaeon]OIN88656.1 MAG: 50S ribosomal protein L24 [Candidatus Aenigmarchaeota archaeon CG1_02_38_14]PIV68444.1 MAG: 50S ribosomal protein L24e [Candidatus Aenigmarchaeota archaeon CG01_land_8_20_14_3_00_37_9]PIW40787.1 MAG: 50S ribosomal protein L24e [Candidatus Aenigmarchaeota archaeon CG15_BIG_FIL_POST_REV_8_21_14_020_37_27]PIX50615.1 MAG: 50S ribosomal protein L24e [Candidatus Aenigmarchaeota archaeon CG_4_8_14_3_um_filter_37_24]PIY
MSKCSFCGKTLKTGTGKMFVTNVNKIYYFCSGKCEKNWSMGRNPKKFKWTEDYRKEKAH